MLDEIPFAQAPFRHQVFFERRDNNPGGALASMFQVRQPFAGIYDLLKPEIRRWQGGFAGAGVSGASILQISGYRAQTQACKVSPDGADPDFRNRRRDIQGLPPNRASLHESRPI